MGCGCLVAFLALLSPRLVLFLIWVFNADWLNYAFESWVWPLLGFFFLPMTTLMYALSVHEFGGVQGFGIVLMIFGVLWDIGAIGTGAAGRRKSPAPS